VSNHSARQAAIRHAGDTASQSWTRRRRASLVMAAVGCLLTTVGSIPGSASALSPTAPPPVSTVAGGGWFATAAITPDGRTYAAGRNSYGAHTGSRAEGHRRQLRIVSGLPTGVLAVTASVGREHLLVVGSDGVAYGSGANYAGQLTGLGNRRRLGPLQGLPAGVRATAVAAGPNTSVVLGDDGVVYGAGNTASGQLAGPTAGQDHNVRQLTPLRGLPDDVLATAISSTYSHTLVLADDGQVYGAGANNDGQLTGTPAPVVRRLRPLTGLPVDAHPTAVSTGVHHSLILTDDGRVFGAGGNDEGQLTGVPGDRATLTPLSLPTGVTATVMSAGCHHTLILGQDGVAYGVGNNDDGQITGNGARSMFAPLTGLPAGITAAAVASGCFHSLVLGSDGKLYGAGDNWFGQLTGGRRFGKDTLTRLKWGVANLTAPKIVGHHTRGATLTARAGRWSPRPTQFEFHWIRTGHGPIEGATSQTYRLRHADVGHRITVRVRALRPEWTAGHATSEPTIRIRR
jgi:alpha-tubulin suppressor-like RCC1 family protein